MFDQLARAVRRSLRETPDRWHLNVLKGALVQAPSAAIDDPLFLSMNGAEARFCIHVERFGFVDRWLNRCAIVEWIERHAH